MIRIEDNIPVPQPDKPDTWQSVKFDKPITCNEDTVVTADGWVSNITGYEGRKLTPVIKAETTPNLPTKPTNKIVNASPAECYLVGGPLNGQRGPIVGNAKVVELEIYGSNGEVTSVELYELGDKPTPTFRYWKGTKDEHNALPVH